MPIMYSVRFYSSVGFGGSPLELSIMESDLIKARGSVMSGKRLKSKFVSRLPVV